MINCIAKKKIAFRNPANKDESITVRPFEFVSLPEWVTKDPMFNWAVKDKILDVSKETIIAKEEPKAEPKEEVKEAQEVKKTVKKPVKKPAKKPAKKE